MAKGISKLLSKSEVIEDLWQTNVDWLHSRYRRRRSLQSKPDEFFANLDESVKEGAPCLFVLSTGRCGTKLLTDILRTSRAIDVHHRPSPELVVPSRLAYEEGGDYPNEFRRATFMARYDLVENSYIKDQIYAETNCRITFLAPYLNQVFGGAKFLHLVRDPITFINSARARGYYQSERADRGHIKPVKGYDMQLWPTMTINQKIAWNWNSTNAFIEEFKETLPRGSVMTVRSEDLFEQADISRSVFDFLETDPPNEKTIKGLIGNPVNASKRGDESNPVDLEGLKSDVKEFAPLAKIYGYNENK